MDRNSWETAIRCLEVALHPNTADAEVIAAVNGFRRTAAGTPLTMLCAEFAGGGDPGAWGAVLDQLNRENLDLRLQLELARTGQDATDRRIAETEQRIRDLGDELREARRRAGLAEQRVADLSAAYAEITDGLKHEIAGLHGALGRAAQRGAPSRLPIASRFADALAAALHGADRPAASGPTPTSLWTA